MTRLHEPVQLELSNGIPVLLQHCEGMVASIYWWVKTGSADEAPHEAGFAHFLEHMLFKDAAAKESGRPSSGQTARFIESLGGDINAYTSFDQTVYHVTSAAHHWEAVLDHFGTMAKPQRFLAKDFEREREVILEELRKNEDSPGRQVFQSLFGITFKKHAYGRPVIGTEKILRSAKLKDLEAFYKRRYVSDNMGIMLVGPLEELIIPSGVGKIQSKSKPRPSRKDQLLKLLEKHFGQKVLKPKASHNAPRKFEDPYRDQAEWMIKRFDVKTPSVNFSFRVPELGHEDMPALDFLAGVLGMGELSRLYQRLFYQTSLVTDISGGIYVPKNPGMLYFQAEFDDLGKVSQVMDEIFKEFKRIADEGPTPEEMSRILVNAESERLYSTQTADGMAGRLGYLKFIVGDLEFDREYLAQLRAVSRSSVQAVAKKYLDFRRMSGVLLLPNGAPEYKVEQLQKASQVLNWGEVTPVVTKKIQSQKEKTQGLVSLSLPSGMEIRYFHRPQSHVFSIHAAVLGGLRLEVASPVDSVESDWGSSYMMALTWAKGTPYRDARKIASMTEGRASSLDGFAGRNSIGMQMTGLERDWNDLSALFTEVLLEPTFPKDELDHARRLAEDSVRSVEDHSSQLCSKLFLETLYHNHPYGKMTHGSLESLPQIHSKKLKAFHQIWVRPERLVLSVSGPLRQVDLEKWAETLEKEVVRLSQSHTPKALPQTLPNELALTAPRTVEKLLGREQLHILVGGLGTEITAKDRFALRLLQTLLGGQSGRLFIELREKRSLAYTVSPISFEGLEKGYVGTYIACAPQKRQEAIQGVAKVLEDLVRKGPTQQEMRRAQEFFLGRRAMDLQSDAAIASHYGLEALYSLESLSEEALIKKIRAISGKELQAVCERYFVKPFQVTSVAG